MSELACLIIRNTHGWLLTVGAHTRRAYPCKNSALRAAMAEAQKGRAAGFYTSVKVLAGPSSSPASTWG